MPKKPSCARKITELIATGPKVPHPKNIYGRDVARAPVS